MNNFPSNTEYKTMWFSERHEPLLFRPISKEQFPDSREAVRISENEKYISVHIDAMHLNKEQIAWKAFYRSICSWFKLNTLADRTAEFCAVIDPGHLFELEKGGEIWALSEDLPLLGPVPYRGGGMVMELGLVVTRSDRLAKPFLDHLGHLSRLSRLPYVEPAMPFVGPVHVGVEGLLATSHATQIAIGFQHAWSELTTGTFLLSSAPPNVDLGGLRFDPYCRLPAPSRLAGHSWILFTVEANEQRHDWGNIKELRETYDRLRQAVKTRQTEIKQNFAEFRRLSLASPDLLPGDARRLIKKVQDKLLQSEGKLIQTGKGAETDIGGFEDLDLYDRFFQGPRLEGTARQAISPQSIGTPSEEGSPPALEPVLLRRTPHMDLIGETPLRPGDRFSVRVFVNAQPARPGEDSREIRIPVPAGTEVVKVDVWIAVTDHFTIRGAREKVLEIPVAPNKSASLGFDLAVRRDVETLTEAEARLWAYFSHQGRPSGQVSIAVLLRREAQNEALATAPPAPSVAARPGQRAVVAIERAAQLPDLTITIKDPRGDQQTLECRISSPHLELTAKEQRCTWNLPGRTGDYVAAQFAQFVQPGIPKLARFYSLCGAGRKLWQAAPGIARNAIWRLIDAGRLRTILVVSEDPYFPWELMIPQRREDGKRTERGQPLGVEFVIGRWIPVDNTSPPQHVQLTSSLVIAPDYPGPNPKPLAHAAEEASLVRACVAGRLLAPAILQQVAASLFASQVDLVHFVCHGAANPAPGIQALYLEDCPFDSNQMAGLPMPAKPDKPFVFLNSCEVGRPVPTLSGIGGFAREFIERGATCVVAPLWSVKDRIAHEVATTFYNRLGAASAVSIAEIIRDIRTRAYSDATPGEDTYASYCFYGDPCATAVLGGQP